MSSLLDLFGLKGKRSPSRPDDIFLDAAKQYADIWSEMFSSKFNCIVACPSSTALGEEPITREYIMAHILLPERKPGDFVNLFGQKLSLVGNDFICSAGFPETRKIRIVMIETLPDGKGNTASIYRTNRPFIGGIASPEDPEEVTFSIMHKFVAMVRTFPEAESVFNTLDKYTHEVNFVGQQSAEGFSKIKPSLRSSLEQQWQKCTDRLCSSSNSVVTTGLGSDAQTTKHIIGQVVESYIMSAISTLLYQWIARQLVLENGRFLSAVSAMQGYSQTDLGIRPELQCSQSEAIRILRSISEALTPIDKLLTLKRTVAKIRDGVDRNVSSKFLNADIELATDDIISFIIWAVIKVSRHYENIYFDIHFAADYHFVASSKTDLGFCLNHFQVALSWIVGHGTRARSPSQTGVEDSGLNSSALSSSPPLSESFGLQLSVKDVSGDSDAKVSSSGGRLPVGICAEAAIAIESFVNEEKGHFSNLGYDYQSGSFLTDSGSESGSIMPAASAASAAAKTNGAQYSWSYAQPRSSLTDIDHNQQLLHHPQLSDKRIIGAPIRLLGRAGGGGGSGNYPEDDITDVKVYSEETNKITTISSIYGGNGFYAAIDVAGGAYTWGAPDCGRLGHNVRFELDSFMAVMSPLQVSSIGHDIRFTQLACGSQHMLAVTESGEVYAWGDNRCAQLGFSTAAATSAAATSRDRPSSSLLLLSSAASLASNDMSAVMASSPMLVESLKHEKVVSVASGSFHSLCLTVNGAVYSWGRAANGRLGQFPDRNIPEHAVGKPGLVRGPWVPVVASPPSPMKGRSRSSSSLAAAGFGQGTASPAGYLYADHRDTAAMTARMLNSSSKVRLAPSESEMSMAQQSNVGVVTIVSIAAGFSHSAAVTSQGEVYTWGCGLYGRLGQGSHTDEYLPKQVMALNRPGIDIVSVACGSGHSMFLSKEGFLFGCGLNRYQQVGAKELSTVRSSFSFDRDCILVPQPVAIRSVDATATSTSGNSDSSNGDSNSSNGLSKLKLCERVACGDYHTVVITKDQRLFTWGSSALKATPDDIKAVHRDITDTVPAPPKQIACAGQVTMVVV